MAWSNISFRADSEMRKKFDAIVAAKGMTPSEVYRILMEKFVAENKEYLK